MLRWGAQTPLPSGAVLTHVPRQRVPFTRQGVRGAGVGENVPRPPSSKGSEPWTERSGPSFGHGPRWRLRRGCPPTTGRAGGGFGEARAGEGGWEPSTDGGGGLECNRWSRQ